MLVATLGQDISIFKPNIVQLLFIGFDELGLIILVKLLDHKFVIDAFHPEAGSAFNTSLSKHLVLIGV